MEVKIEKQLGKGAMGTVYLLCIKSSKQRTQLALKLMESKESSWRERMLQEMEIMKDLNHENIVKYYAGYKHKDQILLLLEFCPGTDLHDYLQARKPLQYLMEPEVYKFASQIASAIVYLHKKHIMHRDIKPQNILLTQDNHVKLADFGISKQLENTMAQAESYLGSPLYMAPEIIDHQQYSYKADSWSFGCVLHELMSLHYAFKKDGEDNSQIRRRILTAQFHPVPRRYNINLQDMVESLLIVDVGKRLNMNDAFSFLQGMREDTADILPPAPEIPILPDKKVVMSAIRKYNIECNQSSGSEDPDPEDKFPEYPEDFDSDSDSDSEQRTVLSRTYDADLDTVIETETITPVRRRLRQSQNVDLNSTASSVISSDDTLTSTSEASNTSSACFDTGHFQDADSYVKEVSSRLRKQLVCLNIDEDNTTIDSRDFKQSDLESSGNGGKKKKKKAFLREKRKSTDVAATVTKEPITLYTRSQKVVYSKQDSFDNKPTVLDQFREEAGQEKYEKVVKLKKIITDPKLLEERLIDVIGSTLYKRYNNLFLHSKSW